MSLRVWLPLNGNLNNQGLANVSATNNGAAVDNAGKIGKCYSFNRNNIVFNITSASLGLSVLNGCSFCAWIYVTENLNNLTIFGTNNTNQINFTIGVHQGKLYIIHREQSNNRELSESDITLNEWHHIAVLIKNSRATFYIDGVEDNSVGCALNPSYANLAYITCIGGWGSSSNFSGKLNDIRIYDHCLSPKEVKEISKGLVLHYKLDDPYVEPTTNLITGITSVARCTIEGNGVRVAWNVSSGDTYLFFNTSEEMVQGTTYTLSFDVEGLNESGVSFAWSNIIGGDNRYLCVLHNGHNVKTFTHNSSESRTFFDDIHRNNTSNFWMGNFQLEKKDHATPYTKNFRGPQTQYDKNIYTEPDGSKWLHIAHHNNPANGVFPSSSAAWSSGVYVDADRWFDVYGTVQKLDRYEFIVKQKVTSSDTEKKYRWIQNKSPLTATWSDVRASNVSRITTSGYTDGTFGGLYILNSNTYMCIANATNGNWYGAFGCWTQYYGGVPGYPNTMVTTGYMDLYVRVEDENIPEVIDYSGYKYNGSTVGTVTTSSDTSRYGMCYNVSNGNAVTTSSIPFTALTNCTISAWVYVQTNGTSGWLPFGGQDNYYYLLATSGGTGAFYHGNAGSNTKIIYRDGVVGTTPLAIGAWHHYCISGIDLSTWTKFGIDDYDSRYGTNWNFTGKVSDVRIYNTVLSADDIKELYDTSAYIYNDGSIAAYEFNEINTASRELHPIPTDNPNLITYNADGSYTCSGYTWFHGDYIPISPSGKTYYYDLEYSNVAGNMFYVGFERYDANYDSGSNNGCIYMVGSSNAASRVRLTGTIDLATALTGNPTAYTKLRILNNWNNSSDTSYKGTIHYISLKEVATKTESEVTKTGVFEGDTFIENQDASISHTGNVIGNQIIEI